MAFLYHFLPQCLVPAETQVPLQIQDVYRLQTDDFDEPETLEAAGPLPSLHRGGGDPYSNYY